MTEKLYESDPYLKQFTAAVLSCQAEGDRWAVTLDRTAFYPEGGGQPADRGTLGGAAVTGVRERNGVIVHTCDTPLDAGKQIAGEIDWPRRFDHMQQHSGEHIVSGMICERFSCDNVGFHLGRDVVTIDFNAPIPPGALRELEDAANAYVWSDPAVEIRSLSGPELDRTRYRSKKAIPGAVRIVTFPGADCCACCGTHVSSAGQVGLVKFLSCQKFREGVRVELLCGGRAVRYLSAAAEQNTKISQALSAKPLETAAAVERLREELAALRARLDADQERSRTRRAAAVTGKGDVLLLEGEMTPEAARRLCAAGQASCGGRCAVFAGRGGAYKYAVAQGAGDLRPLIRELNAALQGRGGGGPTLAQGSAAAEEGDVLAFFREKGFAVDLDSR